MAITRRAGAFVAAGAGVLLMLTQGAAWGSTGVNATWSFAPVPAPDGTATLTGDAPQLSCVTAAFCAIMPNPGYLTVLSNGVPSTVAAPHSADPHSNDSLMSLACIRVGLCRAIGSTSEGPWDPLHEVRDILHDGTWKASTSGSQAYEQIACGTDHCVAIGNTIDEGPFEARIDDWTAGGQWGSGTLAIPFSQGPQPPDVTLSSAACPTSGRCVALGYADGRNTPLRSVLFYPQGDLWQGVAEVLPHGADPDSDAGTVGAQAGMSCVSSYNCIGLGQYRDRASGHAHLFAEILRNRVLSAQALPLPGGISNATQVSAGQLDCASMTECAGIASWQGPGGQTHSVLVRLSGGTWSVEGAPRPAGAVAGSPVSVNSVACPTAATCIAVGSYQVELHGHPRTRAADWIWNGTRWAPHGIEADGMHAVQQSLTAVQCPAPTQCTAVGVFDGQPGYALGTFTSG